MLVVGNHSGGQLPPDVPVLLTAWWRERGEDEPVYVLLHSFVLGLPGIGSWLARGENGAISISLGSLTRLRSNPFWALIDADVAGLVDQDLAARRR